MNTVNFLALVWGFPIVAVTLSMLISPKRIRELFSTVEKETTAYLTGIVTFTIGLMTVLSNNTWEKDWRTLITVLGWLTIVKGLTWIFMPQKCIAMMNKIKEKDWISYAVLVLLFVGLVAVYFGFTGK